MTMVNINQIRMILKITIIAKNQIANSMNKKYKITLVLKKYYKKIKMIKI